MHTQKIKRSHPVNDHKLGVLQQQTFLLSPFWRLNSESGFWQGWFLVEALREGLFPALDLPRVAGSPWWSLAYRHIPPISASVILVLPGCLFASLHLPSLCAPESKFPSSSKDTSH